MFLGVFKKNRSNPGQKKETMRRAYIDLDGEGRHPAAIS
jgi:hypothetical protein